MEPIGEQLGSTNVSRGIILFSTMNKHFIAAIDWCITFYVRVPARQCTKTGERFTTSLDPHHLNLRCTNSNRYQLSYIKYVYIYIVHLFFSLFNVLCFIDLFIMLINYNCRRFKIENIVCSTKQTLPSTPGLHHLIYIFANVSKFKIPAYSQFTNQTPSTYIIVICKYIYIYTYQQPCQCSMTTGHHWPWNTITSISMH